MIFCKCALCVTNINLTCYCENRIYINIILANYCSRRGFGEAIQWRRCFFAGLESTGIDLWTWGREGGREKRDYSKCTRLPFISLSNLWFGIPQVRISWHHVRFYRQWVLIEILTPQTARRAHTILRIISQQVIQQAPPTLRYPVYLLLQVIVRLTFHLKWADERQFRVSRPDTLVRTTNEISY